MKLETNYSKIKSEIIKQLNFLFDDQDHSVTCWVPLGTDGENDWAVVLAWMDYDNNDAWEVFGKVAYQPKNSMMQEYDMDWTIPYDEKTGEVLYSELAIPQDSISRAADQLVQDWKSILPTIEIKEEKTMKKANIITEEKFNALVMEYVLEGHSIQESIVLAEDTITPEMINDLEKTPAYKKLKKDIEYYFKAVDGIEGYRDGDFKDAPIEALQDEADFCKDTANFLGSINFRGFKPEKQKELMQDTAADMEYLDRSALRLTNLLKKQDDSMYLKSDGSVNVNTNQKPGEYARRALRKIRDLFARLGQKWDYDPDFDYKSLPSVDYKMFVADSKNISELPDWKQGIMNTVNTAVNEGICDKCILLNMANDLDLNEDQKDFYTKYVYYVLD